MDTPYSSQSSEPSPPKKAPLAAATDKEGEQASEKIKPLQENLNLKNHKTIKYIYIYIYKIKKYILKS